MKPGTIAGRITRPENCVMGLGIPSSELFLKMSVARNPCPPSICRRFAAQFDVFSEYEYQIIRHFRRYLPRMARLGLRIFPELTLKGFGELFRQDEVHVVILFSHWSNEAIEFTDGFAGVSAILSRIPKDFKGIIDLCICHPCALIPQLRQRSESYLIRFTTSKATPRIWLVFYLALLRHLQDGSRSYLTALEEVGTRMLRIEVKS